MNEKEKDGLQPSPAREEAAAPWTEKEIREAMDAVRSGLDKTKECLDRIEEFIESIKAASPEKEKGKAASQSPCQVEEASAKEAGRYKKAATAEHKQDKKASPMQQRL